MNKDLLAAIAVSRRLPEGKRNELMIDVMDKLAKQRKTHTMIRMSCCPICNGKLNRGKKDSKNGYKRKWTCITCNVAYTI